MKKGRELSLEEVRGLELGTKVWVEYDSAKWSLPFISGIETLGTAYSYLERKDVLATFGNDNSYMILDLETATRYNTKYYEIEE